MTKVKRRIVFKNISSGGRRCDPSGEGLEWGRRKNPQKKRNKKLNLGENGNTQRVQEVGEASGKTRIKGTKKLHLLEGLGKCL